jgi:hypothetical protein
MSAMKLFKRRPPGSNRSVKRGPTIIQRFYTDEAYQLRCRVHLRELRALENYIAHRLATAGCYKNKRSKEYLKRVLASLNKETAKRAARGEIKAAHQAARAPSPEVLDVDRHGALNFRPGK